MGSAAETQTWSGGTPWDGALGFCLALLARFGQRGAASEVHEFAADPPVDIGFGLEDASEVLRKDIDGVRALMIVSLAGHIESQVVLDASIDSEVLSEFATLIRIACRTSVDSGMGDLLETTWTCKGGTVLSRHVDAERFMVLVGGPTLRTSLARYVLRQTARRVQAREFGR
jgi:predicted regulator of Ras-like GTPase activity (Roadblock/LC7/MglB family)